MKTKKILDEVAGDVRIEIEVSEGDPYLHDYGIPRQAWIRGVRFMKYFGAEEALDVIDQRAERAANRGDYASSRHRTECLKTSV